MKTKNKIISITLMTILCACVEIDSEYNRKTYSGYVASDYTLIHLKHYGDMFEYIYRFNEYYLQPTISKRDSVDRLYFKDVKLLRGEDEHTWTLRRLSHTSTDEILSVRTNGHPLNTPEAVWTIRDLSTPKEAPEMMGLFEVKNQADGTWLVKEHKNRDKDFDYTSSWTVRFDKGKPHGTLRGSGRLLSIERPQLQLDYTIETPLQINQTEYRWPFTNEIAFTDGIVKILATDVRANNTEKMNAHILSPDRLEVHYKNYREEWWYNMGLRP